MKLGDWLVSRGKLTREQLARALQDQAFFNERLGTSLIRLGYIDEDDLGAYLADVSRARYAPAARLEKVPPEVIATVPARIAAKYRVVPIAIETRKLHLAMRDPKDLLALDEIAFLTGLPIEPYVASEYRIVQAIERYYRIRLGTRTIPVAGGPGDAPPARSRSRTATAPAAPPKPAEPEMGLDGLPMDADPADFDQPFVTTTSQSAAFERDEPLPPSLEAWRAAQEDAGVPPPPAPAQPPPLPAAASAATQPTPVVRPAPRTAPPFSPTGPTPAVALQAVPAVSGPPTLEAVSLRMREAETRDDVFNALLDFASAHFRRTALFVVQQDRALGWSGRGEGLFPARIRSVIVPLDRPSLFVFFRDGGDYFYGPVPDLPSNAKFYLDLGVPPPARVVLLPLTIMGRTAVILYADNGTDASQAPDIQVLRRLLKKASLALEVLILRNKIMMI